MYELTNQIAPKLAGIIIQIFALLSIGIVVLLTLICSIGIVWQMTSEAKDVKSNARKSSCFGLLRSRKIPALNNRNALSETS